MQALHAGVAGRRIFNSASIEPLYRTDVDPDSGACSTAIRSVYAILIESAWCHKNYRTRACVQRMNF